MLPAQVREWSMEYPSLDVYLVTVWTQGFDFSFPGCSRSQVLWFLILKKWSHPILETVHLL
jgi:hypothetical protein